ncbi:unnamed protein product [Adineta ricciae]|uniref:Uncharacterized protein n=1 Tax=Adineta ricciae TaxID=249248 RepID=A0A813QW34_ADIRI|nr:unnamed protein product [Adineta ricciae]
MGSFTFSCSCLSSIDQFCITSRHARVRRLSNIKLTHRIVCILTVICLLHGIPALMFFEISPITNKCVNVNQGFSIYILVYAFCLNSIGPLIIMIVFGYLTYRNVHSIRIPVDRQLVKMTLCQVILIFMTAVPYATVLAYNLLTATLKKDSNRLVNEYFAISFLGLWTYLYYGGSFYVFFISSSRFRRTVKEKVFLWQNRNQINPHVQASIQ